MIGLRQKISLGFGGLLIIILLIGIQSILQLSRLGDSIDVILRENYRSNHHTFMGFTPEALLALRQYSWPGNIRELSNVVERAAIFCQTDRVGLECLPPNLIPRQSLPGIGDPVPLEKIEELHIRRILAAAGSLQEAADILGIDQATLWRRRKKYGI